MKKLIAGFAACCLIAFTDAALAQDKNAIPLPPVDANSYDPQLSAKEAALINWDLAVSGIRVGRIASINVLATDRNGASFEGLVKQANFATKTILTRYNSANWYFHAEPDLTPPDRAILQEAVSQVTRGCMTGSCKDERSAILASFSKMADSFNEVANQAEKIADSKEKDTERALMAEIFNTIGAYLESSAWHENLTLTEAGRDGDEVAARLVGALGVWNNLAPYIGLIDKDADTAIEAAIDHLLRDMRRNTRNKPVLLADGPEIAALKKSATTLAGALKHAADLFKG